VDKGKFFQPPNNFAGNFAGHYSTGITKVKTEQALFGSSTDAVHKHLTEQKKTG